MMRRIKNATKRIKIKVEKSKLRKLNLENDANNIINQSQVKPVFAETWL